MPLFPNDDFHHLSASANGHGEAPIGLDLPLKGARTYLHSTTILAALVSRWSLTDAVELEFRRMIHHPISLVRDGGASADRVGRFAFRRDGVWHAYGIYADASRAITGHVEDNERAILAASVREGEMASAGIGMPGNFIDTIVTLNKALVAEDAGADRKVIFSSLRLDVIPQADVIGVKLTKSMGKRIYVSDILWNRAKIGSLTFMAVR